MSRVAKNPVTIPSGVDVVIKGQNVSVKGGKGTLALDVSPMVALSSEDGKVLFAGEESVKGSWAQAGTARSLVNNMVIGCSQGFQKKLLLNGVGYRAQAKGKVLNLTLGFSHPVAHALPEGITAETPTQTEIIISGIDKQAVGETAAKIRAYRPPEPYKGKGIKYADEHIIRKAAKKK